MTTAITETMADTLKGLYLMDRDYCLVWPLRLKGLQWVVSSGLTRCDLTFKSVDQGHRFALLEFLVGDEERVRRVRIGSVDVMRAFGTVLLGLGWEPSKDEEDALWGPEGRDFWLDIEGIHRGP